MALQELDAPTGVRVLALPDARVLTLRSDVWELDVLPGTGAALGGGRVRTADGVWRDLLRPTRGANALGDPEKCSSFPMIPWSNRIRGGALSFDGRTWQLQQNGADGSAIHGAARHSTWDVAARTSSSVTLDLDTSDLTGVNFPWCFSARLVYEVEGPTLSVTTTVRNTDAEPFPAGFGHHPYLQRSLLPVGDPSPLTPGNPVLQIPAHGGYALDAGNAVRPAGPVPPRADFRSRRPLGHAFVDDVLTARDLDEPVRVEYPDAGVAVALDADPVFEHLVVYAPRRRPYFAIEPATNVNNGFALHDAGVPGTGVFVLEPGQSRTGTFTLTVESL